MENKFTGGWLAVTVVFLCLGITACKTSPVRNAQLEEAKRQYEEASRDADIVRRATTELDLARDALEMAETRRLKGANSHIAHYVYLFEQYMRMATLAVEQRSLDDKLLDKADRDKKAAMIDKVVKAEDAVDGENWDLLLAAANAAVPGDDSETAPQADKSASSDQTMGDDVMTLGDVLFKVNRATFAAGSEGMIEKLVLFLNRNSNRMAVIEGHTDNTGDREYNQSLSRDRAFAVQEALVKAGISAHRLAVRGVGESDPVASNELESGRRLNRRVDVVLLE